MFPAGFPFRQFIAPCSVELRAAQAVRVFRGIERSHRAIVPQEPAARRFIARARQPRDRQNARRSVHHHLARIAEGFADQRDVPAFRRRERRQAERHARCPFCPCPRLAGPAPAQNEPDAPVAAGRQLRITRLKQPFRLRCRNLRRRQSGQPRFPVPAFPQVLRFSCLCASAPSAPRRPWSPCPHGGETSHLLV